MCLPTDPRLRPPQAGQPEPHGSKGGGGAAVAPLAATPPGGPSRTGFKRARSLDLANVEGTAMAAPPDALPKRTRGPPPGAALEIRREPPR